MVGRIVEMAWRSIWRNRRRTVITAMAVGVGLAALMFTEALMAGMTDHMVRQTTEAWLGDGQIHRNGFRETGRIALTVAGLDSLTSMLSEDGQVTAFTCRLISPASAQSATEMRPVTLIGVDPSTDPELTMLETAVDSGAYFSGDSTDLILGMKLARDLDAGLGDVVVLTAAGADSGLTSRLFFVTGLCDFGSDDLDRYTAFINIRAAGGMLGLAGECHEIALRLQDTDQGLDPDLPLWSRYSIQGNTALGWGELAGQIQSMLGMVDMSMAISALILFGLVVFGIVNSLFMSVYERMYEFGVMKAIGTRPGSVAAVVVLEAFWLGIVSMALGTAMDFLRETESPELVVFVLFDQGAYGAFAAALEELTGD